MPITLTMPRLSDTMEAGTVIKWNVKEGDKVRSGDVLADIETDKATMEMQCFDDGTIAKILVDAGKQVKVGTTIAVIAGKNEDVKSVAANAGGGGASGSASPAAAPAKPAAEQAPHALDSARAASSAHDEEHLDDGGGRRLRVSPVARRMAEEQGIDLAAIRGSGPAGRIIKRDILAIGGALAGSAGENLAGAQTAANIPTATALALPKQASGSVAGSPVAALAPLTSRSVALSGMRQTIARRLVESKTSIPHYQVTMKFAMDELLGLRKKVNDSLEAFGVKLSVNDFLVRACALAMAKHPYFNASFAGESIAIHGEVNVGIAISLPEDRGGGLVVGVIRNADQKSLRQISADAKYLAEKARTKGLSMEEMNAATFTISNLGMFGVEHFTAIINPPNSAILACGAAIEQPVVRNHQIAVGWEMQATLSLDHRVIDGAMAAEYLSTLKKLIESPAALMV
ncbi:MAG: 2-oxo acid dehydrogenase subunit E2 [Phycisphaerae bacterium]|jgi:pyruvate dehydrogenase E2 component (dihydrolipoamide acetyltransferase)|nr:2-oxo acid dehydrogenase subunit E2 [Phycisphaerae bacterium]